MNLIFAFILYLATALLVSGLVWKIIRYVRTPVPHMIAVAPVPQTRLGVLARLMRETIFFESLFRASKWTWLFGWTFHYALAVVLLRHLYFVTDPPPFWLVMVFVPSDYAAWLMVMSLAGLLVRRVAVDRIRYISSPSDYAMLLLLLLIGGSGLLLRHSMHVDITAVRDFMLGLLELSPQALPVNLMLYVHIGSVAILAVVFPFSKLVHFPGYYFSPGHNQRYRQSSQP